jgi:hypothetical protein
MSVYSDRSPYYKTKTFGNFLDVMVNRPIQAASSDVLITLSSAYHQRPDLLAFDLYKDSRLWWVFTMRNPDVFEDPVFDFVSGVKFYAPTQQTVSTALGL